MVLIILPGNSQSRMNSSGALWGTVTIPMSWGFERIKLHFILSYHLIFRIIKKNELDYIMTPLKFERLQHFTNKHDSYPWMIKVLNEQ